MDVPSPQSLTTVKIDPDGLRGETHYARDPQGNIWVSYLFDGVAADWQLYKRADEIQQTGPVTMESVLRG